MHLQRLTLTNFKCFPTQELRLSKITILLGANSTGKSSILQGILAPLQSDQFPTTLSANGPLVDLGDFASIAFGHRRDAEVSIDLRIDGDELGSVSLRGTFRRSPKTGMPEVAAAELSDDSFHASITRNDRFKGEWSYDAEKDRFRRNVLGNEQMQRFYLNLAGMLAAGSRKQPTGAESTGDEGRAPGLEDAPRSGTLTFTRPYEFFRRLDQPRYILLSIHLTTLSTMVQRLRTQFNYVGSFRQEPHRSYPRVSRGDLKVQRDGQNYIEQIAEWQEQEPRRLTQLKSALRSLKLVSSVRTHKMRSGLFQVSVQPQASTMSISLADVGFGVSQILPILVADLQLPRGGTLAVSQPEIHLHPSAQADFADYLVRRIRSAQRRFIVETHSEYLINRLRLLVANGSLSAEDLSIVYLSNDGVRSQSHEVRFTTDGKVEGAPKEFFQTYMADVMNIAMQAGK
jgi:predicted ATPase